MRRGLLGQFPVDIPLTVVQAGTPFYARTAAERPLHLLPLGDAPLPPIADAQVIVDGLHAVADPAGALRAIRAATGGARVFALVANAAYAPAVAAFLTGGALAIGHPIVAADLDALLRASGWHAVDRIPLIDRTIAGPTIPYTIAAGGVTMTVVSSEVSERVSTAGFLVVADPT